ncbi:MAG: DUF2125 domain-containing protein [Rhodobacteraceae bacterium]|nr:DUF2125 domain-containing protein [Paracoccaceae bacterium]
MRFILWMVAAIAVLYSGYWYSASRTLQGEATASLAELQAAGLANVGTVSVSGFPSRFDVTVDAPEFSSADGQLGWAADQANIHALSYQPNHVITIFPETQTLRIGSERITLRSPDLRASAVFGLSSDLPLDRATLAGSDLGAESSAGWMAELATLRAAIRQGASPEAPEIGIEMADVSVQGPLAELLLRAGLPARAEHARLDAIIGLNRPIDRNTPLSGIEPRSADIRSVELDWNGVEIRGRGALTVLGSGQLDGRIDLDIRQWQRLFGLIRETGAVQPNMENGLRQMLTLMAAGSGDPDILRLPLIFAAGRMSLGPVPLGPAPRF